MLLRISLIANVGLTFPRRIFSTAQIGTCSSYLSYYAEWWLL